MEDGPEVFRDGTENMVAVRILVAIILIVCILGCDAERKGSTEGAFEMAKRVVFISEELLRKDPGLYSNQIGRLNGGIWRGMEDERLLLLLEQGHSVPLLYFSTGEYSEAILDLNPTEIQEVIQRRLGESERILSQTLSWIYRDEREALRFILDATLESEQEWRQWCTYLDEKLRRIARVTGWNRYRGIELSILLESTIEREYLVVAELKDCQNQAKADGLEVLQAFYEEAIEHFESTAQAGANLMSALDDSSGIGLPVFADPERGFWITPTDARLENGLEALVIPFIRWEEGILARISIRQASHMKHEGKTVKVTFVSGSAFGEAMSTLTGAQFRREVKGRLGDSRLLTARMLSHVLDVEIEQALLRISVATEAQRMGKEELASALLDKIPDFVAILRATQAAYYTASSSSVPDLAGEVPDLLALERRTLSDLRFFNKLLRLDRWEEVAAFLGDLVLLKEEDIAQIRHLSGLK